MLLLIISAAAPSLMPYSASRTFPDEAVQAPSSDHILGTDLLGRDVFSRVLYGGRHTLLMAGIATAISGVSGFVLGAAAALGKGLVDRGISVVLDALLAVPGLVLALTVITLLGQGDLQLALAVGLGQIARFARVSRIAILAVGTAPFVEAAYATGATHARVLVHHLLPNVASILLAYLGVLFSYAIITVGALGFLGLGGDPGRPDWGTILAEGRFVLRSAPWVTVAPSTLIFLTVLSINTLIDSLGRRKP